MGAHHDRQPSLEQLSPQRRSLTAAALRKGTIRIGVPVPVENSGPSPVWPPTSSTPPLLQSGTSEESVSVAEITGNGDLVALAHNVKKLQAETYDPFGTKERAQIEESLDVNATRGDGVTSMMDHDAFEHASAVQRTSRHSPPLRQHRSSYIMREDMEGSATDRVSSSVPRSSITEPQDLASSSGASTSGIKKKRRSGSIRTAFRRMFSKKEKNETLISHAGRRHEYHKSESALHMPRGALSNVAEESLYQSRLEPDDDYLSRTPIDTPRLPFPMNINAPVPSPYGMGAPEETGQAGHDADASPSPHRRRNTLPSIVIAPAEAEALNKYWGKGATTNPRIIQQPQPPVPPLIGLAITSNTTQTRQKRRSRSADALRDVAASHERQQRADFGSKDAEIRYWKTVRHHISESTEHVPLEFRKSQAGSIGEVSNGRDDMPGRLSPVLAQTQNRGSRGSRNSMERGSQTSPNLEDQSTIHRVDQRLSQIEINMAQLAHSMQALSGRESAGSSTVAPKSTTFRLEKPPAPKSAHTHSRANPSLALSSNPVYPMEAMSARNLKSAGAPVARSVSLKQPQMGPQRTPKHSPSMSDLPSRIAPWSQQDELPRAVPHDGTSPLPSILAQSLLGRSHVAERMMAPGVHNFSTPFPPHSPTPKTPPTHMATKGTDSSNSTGGSSFTAGIAPGGLAGPPPPPAFSSHHRGQASGQLLGTGFAGNQPVRTHQIGTQTLQVPQGLLSTESSPTRFVDHLAPIYTALKRERTVRKALETQVASLQRDVYQLNNIVAVMRRTMQKMAEEEDDDEESGDDAEQAEFWQGRGPYQGLHQRVGSGQGNAFAQAQAQAQAAQAHAEAQAQARQQRRREREQESLMAQYALALQQEQSRAQPRTHSRQQQLQQQYTLQSQPAQARTQRRSWHEAPHSQQQQQQLVDGEADEADDDDDEEEDEDDLYERSGDWVAAARPTAASSGSSRTAARSSGRAATARGGRGDEGVAADWQGEMF